jgi:hypothetical protein
LGSWYVQWDPWTSPFQGHHWVIWCLMRRSQAKVFQDEVNLFNKCVPSCSSSLLIPIS